MRQSFAACALVVGAGLVAACGGSDDTATSAPPTVPVTSSASPSPSPSTTSSGGTTPTIRCTAASDLQFGAVKITLRAPADHVGEAFVADGPNGITYMAANIYDKAGTRIATAGVWVGRRTPFTPLNDTAAQYSVYEIAATSFHLDVLPGTEPPRPGDGTAEALVDQCVEPAS